MIVVSTPEIEGRNLLQSLGVVQGSTVRTRAIGRDIMAGLKTIVGGEISEYSDLLTKARQQAVQRMIKDAEKLGANAVVNLRFETATIMSNAAEILAYGTAVVMEDQAS